MNIKQITNPILKKALKYKLLLQVNDVDMSDYSKPIDNQNGMIHIPIQILYKMLRQARSSILMSNRFGSKTKQYDVKLIPLVQKMMNDVKYNNTTSFIVGRQYRDSYKYRDFIIKIANIAIESLNLYNQSNDTNNLLLQKFNKIKEELQKI